MDDRIRWLSRRGRGAQCGCCYLEMDQDRVHGDPLKAYIPTQKKEKLSLAKRAVKHFGRKKEAIINPQTASPLFRLPAELRELIWKETLRDPPKARAVHFHVYDRVIDSCTYAEPSKAAADHQANRRACHLRISILLTCRAVYGEALSSLYAGRTFQLVILPGLARPHEAQTRHNIGKLEDCRELFERFEQVHLVIQPGRRPAMRNYAARIRQAIAMLNLEGMREMCVDFFFNIRAHQLDLDFQEREPIFEALNVLATLPETSRMQLSVGTSLAGIGGHARMVQFREAIGAMEKVTMVHDPLRRLAHNTGSAEMDLWVTYQTEVEFNCSRRGLHGRGIHYYEPSWSVRAAVYSTFWLLSPITLPTYAICSIQRKFDKGEWVVSLPSKGK